MKIDTSMNLDTINDKYNFYYDKRNRTVICTTFYKGKSIRAIAKCDPKDSFNLETGKQLAYLRCREKFLKTKAGIAIDAYAEAWAALCRAEKCLQNTADFVTDVRCKLDDIRSQLAALEASLY